MADEDEDEDERAAADHKSTSDLEAGASRDGGEPGKGGLGILFIAAGLGLAMLLSLVGLLAYFAMKP